MARHLEKIFSSKKSLVLVLILAIAANLLGAQEEQKEKTSPLGDHWLLKDANLVLTGAFEVTPISARPQLAVGFQPLPVLVLKGGGSLGFGWNMLGFEGLCALDEESKKYEAI